LAHGAHLGTPEGLATILDMGTETAGRIFYRKDGYGIRVGHEADLVVLDCQDFAEAIVSRPTRLWVFKGGRLVARNSAVGELFL
jgi:cytosine deaminase